MPAHAAARARVLPVAPAPRAALEGRRLAPAGRPEASPVARGCKLAASMSHDTDKLIRQLSLVAFLMAERRAADRPRRQAERRGLLGDVGRGVRAPLLLRPRGAALARRAARSRSATSSRARSSTRSAPSATSCRRSSSPTTSSPRCRRASTCSRASSRTRSRCASRCRTSTLGRPGFPRRRPRRRARRGARPRLLARDAGRLSKLETAISKQRTVRFEYWSIARDEQARAHDQPLRAAADEGGWYVVGRDHGSDAIRTFKGLADPRRHPLRDAPRARLPAAGGVRRRRAPAAPPWQMGETVGEARIELSGDTAWWVERAYGAVRARWRTASSSRRTPTSRHLAALDPAPGRPRRAARAGRAAPRGRRRALRRVASATTAPPPTAADAPRRSRGGARSGRRARSHPERFGVLQALLAYLLAACGEEPQRRDPGARARRALPDPDGGARGAPRRCSTSSTSAAAATRSTRSCAATRCTSTRSCSATRSARRRG